MDEAKLRWLDQFPGQRDFDEIDRDLSDRIGETKKREASPSTANHYLVLRREKLRMAHEKWE